MSCDKPTVRLTTVGDTLRDGKVKVKSILCPHCTTFLEVAVPNKAGSSVLNCRYCSIPILVEHEHVDEYVVYASGGRGNPRLIGWHYTKGSAEEKNDFSYPYYFGKPKTSKRTGTFKIKNREKRVAL